jgi:hypothetical protein
LDPAFQALLTTLATNHTNQTLFMQQLASSSAPKGPTAHFPKWDGTNASVPVFLAQIGSYRADPFFTPVTDWTTTIAGQEPYSQRIYANMMATGKLPVAQLDQFLHRPEYVNRGIDMLHSLITKLNPSRPEHRLNDVREVSNLDMANDTAAMYMRKVRGYATRLHQVTVDQLMPLFALLGLDQGRYRGILDRFTAGDPAVVNVDINALEELMLAEDVRRSTINPGDVPLSQPSANRATQRGPAPAPSPCAPAPAPSLSDDAPLGPNDPAVYPPHRGLQWKRVNVVFKEKKMCPFCFARASFHWEEGCPALAKLGYVLAEDKDKAEEIKTKFTKYMADRPSAGRPSSNRDTPSRGPRAQRATSSERPGPSAPAPKPAPQPAPATAPSPPPPHPTHYPDTHDMDSDSADDEVFIQEYGNLIDASGNSIKPNASSTH